MSVQEIEVARKTHPTFVAAVSDRDFGWEAYRAGWPIARLAKDDEKRGWWAAYQAQTFAECISYFAEQEYDMSDDYEWIRRGC